MFGVIKKGIIFFVISLLVFPLVKNIYSYKGKLSFYHENRLDLEELREKNRGLKSEVKYSQDYYKVEKRIREDLNFLKENEVAYIIPEATVTPAPKEVVAVGPMQEWIALFSQNVL